jgi:hypothetical protein
MAPPLALILRIVYFHVGQSLAAMALRQVDRYDLPPASLSSAKAIAIEAVLPMAARSDIPFSLPFLFASAHL